MIELAYALGRAGDKRGGEALVTALGATRRDVRAEAARRLALLERSTRDPRARKELPRRESAQPRRRRAAQLPCRAQGGRGARPGPQGSEVIRRRSGSRCDRTRGLAGRKDVVPRPAQAAGGCAVQRVRRRVRSPSQQDQAARALLVKQLEIPSLRVNAARSLRKLDPKLDPVPLLQPLLTALATAKDTGQVQVAEAILLLAGPIAWSPARIVSGYPPKNPRDQEVDDPLLRCGPSIPSRVLGSSAIV